MEGTGRRNRQSEGRKNMENSLKGLMLAAGVVITCIVVGLGFYISREAKNTSSGGISQITSMNSEYQNMDKTLYDGISVSGREVIEAIDKFKDEIDGSTFKVTVFTKKMPATGTGATGVVFAAGAYPIEDAKNKNNNSYINPDGSFLGNVVKDANGLITELKFSQQ